MNVYDEINSSKAVLLDVRTEQEWNTGHVKGAVHFELTKLQNGKTPKIPQNRQIYTYCRSGSRSQMANLLLNEQGYSKVDNLGGINDVLELSKKFELEN